MWIKGEEMIMIDKFETTNVHPRVAAMLDAMGWIFLHECLTDTGRMDFLCLNPENGDLAIIECKVTILSAKEVINQVGQYHEDFDIKDALQWVFVWDQPSKNISEIFEACHVSLFTVPHGNPTISPYPKLKAKQHFYRNFYRFYPFHEYFPTRTERGVAIHPILEILDSEKSKPVVSYRPVSPNSTECTEAHS